MDLATKTALESYIADNPDDPSGHLIYADFLDENGSHTEALAYRISQEQPYKWQELFERGNDWPAGTIARVGGYPRPVYCNDLVAAARRAIGWIDEHRAALDRAADAIARERGWLDKAESGDVQALLAHRSTRRALLSGGITQYTRKRAAIAAAKRILLAREQRRADRQAAETARRGDAGRIHRLWIAKLRERCIELARHYHRRQPLYLSKYAEIVYGRGGQEVVDWTVYSKRYRYHPARWRNAGVRLDSETQPRYAIVENFRGREVARIPL